MGPLGVRGPRGRQLARRNRISNQACAVGSLTGLSGGIAVDVEESVLRLTLAERQHVSGDSTVEVVHELS